MGCKILSKNCPRLSKEWSEKNQVSPDEITIGSNKRVWWKGKCGHEWEAIVKNRVNGAGCPYCNGNRVLKGFNDLASLHPRLAAEWSEKNNGTGPEDVTAKCNKKVLWKCSSGHEWMARISDRTEGHGCPYCAGKLLAGFNDLATTRPDLLTEWSDRNECGPQDVTEFSRKSVWWKCHKCGYEWKATVITKVKGTECPQCRHMRTTEHYAGMLAERREERKERFAAPLRMLELYAEKTGMKFIKDYDGITGIPFQYYLTDYRVALEFSERHDGTKKWRSYNEVQNDLCLRNRVKMIRVLEKGIEPFDDCLCIIRDDFSEESVREALEVVFSMLGCNENKLLDD